jgi:hypothetical protein
VHGKDSGAESGKRKSGVLAREASRNFNDALAV